MSAKVLPFSKDFLESVAQEVGTPFHIYDQKAILENAQKFYQAFSWTPGGFRNFFAVKALPNPWILKLVTEAGMGLDCSSLGELLLAQAVGIRGDRIMFTSNDTPDKEFQKAYELGAVINLDDITHIDALQKALGGKLPELLCFRYNPGPLKAGNALIGKPEEAKYGLTRPQILEAYARVKALGVKRFGLHTMVASNELNPDYFVETAQMLFELAVELKEKVGVSVEFLNLGGGIGIPYRLEQKPVDLEYVSQKTREAFDKTMAPAGLGSTKLWMENGRVVTGPYGYLITRAIHRKSTYKEYIGVDACMANLMRPGMYGAYHHITVPGKEQAPVKTFDVVGSLCENNDKFAIDRSIPEPDLGDLVVIHETGAHGHAMGFNYNAKLRSAEVLWKGGKDWQLIRRHETHKDLFATLDYPGL